MSNQRATNKRGQLSRDHIDRLEALGFVWDAVDSMREERFAELAAFREREGHCNVPDNYPDNPALATWVSNQRSTKKRGKLPPDHIARLEAMGFVWDVLEAVWEKRFAELAAFLEREGHCDVPKSYPDNAALGTWVSNQRTAKRSGKLSRDHIDRLEALGFVWELFERDWEERFIELAAFQRREGHCDVPKSFPESPALGRWVVHQRGRGKRGELSPDRIARFDALGFVWDTRDSIWDERFAELAAFREREGHCSVPQAYPDNPELGRWVGRQRNDRKANKLSPDRIRRLEELGFEWDGRSKK